MQKLLGCIVFIVLVSGCVKNPLTPAPAVLAAYTISGGDSCTGAIVSGRYVADTALTGSNTVTITVNVTIPGPYLISSNTVNGISFRQESTFTTTGTQTVVLAGTGTPTDIDTASFTVTASITPGDSCSFSITTVQGIPPQYYLTCLLNGVYKSFSDSTIATNSQIPGNSGYQGLDVRGFDTTLNAASQLELGVSSAGRVAAGIYTDSTSAKTYSNYLDISGQTWSADTTAGSSFTVVVTIVNTSNVQGTFSGKIKDMKGAGTDSILITNGMFSVPVQ